jgi:DNA-binding MarR family transcriptional regulator
MEATTTELGFVDALVRLSHLVQNVFSDVSHDYELTPQQTHLLCVLHQGPVGMTGLSRSLHLEKSSLTGLVDRVERRGLVTRTRYTHDRRACEIALTEPGARLAVAAHDEVSARLEKLAGEVPPAHRELVVSVITQVLNAPPEVVE